MLMIYPKSSFECLQVCIFCLTLPVSNICGKPENSSSSTVTIYQQGWFTNSYVFVLESEHYGALSIRPQLGSQLGSVRLFACLALQKPSHLEGAQPQLCLEYGNTQTYQLVKCGPVVALEVAALRRGARTSARVARGGVLIAPDERLLAASSSWADSN